MAAPINGIGAGVPNLMVDSVATRGAEAPARAPQTGAMDFGDLLGDAIVQASAAEESADDMAARFADGDQSVGIHEVMIEAEKANLAVRYAVTLKNRAVEAYREIMRTPV